VNARIQLGLRQTGVGPLPPGTVQFSMSSFSGDVTCLFNGDA